MIVVIQTTVPGRLCVWLVHQGALRTFAHRRVQWHGSDKALALFVAMLDQAGIKLSKVQKFVVVRGPGSFTSVRVGLIIANTLGWLLAKPVRGIVARHELSSAEVLKAARLPAQRGVVVRPWYGKKPNITKPKKRIT